MGESNISDNYPMVKYFIEKSNITVPSYIFKEQFIQELERSLNSANALNLSRFFKKWSTDIENSIDKKQLDEYLNSTIKINQKLNAEYGQLLNEDDLKIIQFLNEHTKSPINDFLEISGPIHFIANILEELDTVGDGISENLNITILLYTYVITYELILHSIDRRLARYLEENRSNYNIKDRAINNFLLRVNRKEEHEHATAGALNKLFEIIFNKKEFKSSILGNKGDSKIFRNKISHSNLFFDQGKNVIVTLDGTEYGIENFKRQYYQNFLFLIKWLENPFEGPITEANVCSMIVDEVKQMFIAEARKCRKYQRYGLQRVFGNILISIKKEATENMG